MACRKHEDTNDEMKRMIRILLLTHRIAGDKENYKRDYKLNQYCTGTTGRNKMRLSNAKRDFKRIGRICVEIYKVEM